MLGIDFNLERLYRRERGEPREARPAATGLAAVLGRVYDAVYAPQDRLVERFVEWRLRRARAPPAARLAYHDRATLPIVANFGLSTQLAALGVCLALGRPAAYLWIVLGCGALARAARATAGERGPARSMADDTPGRGSGRVRRSRIVER